MYQNRNADGSSLTITNASITGNQIKNGSKNGGGVYTNVRTVEISDSAISDNTATEKISTIFITIYRNNHIITSLNL